MDTSNQPTSTCLISNLSSLPFFIGATFAQVLPQEKKTYKWCTFTSHAIAHDCLVMFDLEEELKQILGQKVTSGSRRVTSGR